MNIQDGIHDIKNCLALPLFGLESEATEEDKLRGQAGIDAAVEKLNEISAYAKSNQDEAAGD